MAMSIRSVVGKLGRVTCNRRNITRSEASLYMASGASSYSSGHPFDSQGRIRKPCSLDAQQMQLWRTIRPIRTTDEELIDNSGRRFDNRGGKQKEKVKVPRTRRGFPVENEILSTLRMFPRQY